MPRKVFLLAPLALVAALLGALAMYRFVAGEVPLALIRGESAKLATGEEQLRKDNAESVAQMEKHGGKVRYFGHLSRQRPGLFVDLSDSRGVASGYSFLKPLHDEGREFFLSLKGTRFSDSDVDYLLPFTNVDYLDLTGTQITDAGAARLQQAIPSVRIIRSDRDREELSESPRLAWMRHLAGYAKAPVDLSEYAGAIPAIPKYLERSKIEVLSGTTFTFENQKFQLLGVLEQDGQNVQQNAKRFAEQWFHSDSSLIQILNVTNPREDENGADLVWVDGGGGRTLNRDLVQMNLVKIGNGALEEYEFYQQVGGKGCTMNVFMPWREILYQASVDYAEGRLPTLGFKWSYD